MLAVFSAYLRLDPEDDLYRAASHMLSVNLINGDAMTMKAATGGPIMVVEWGYLGRGKFQRRDFRLDVLTGMSSFQEEKSLFSQLGQHEIFKPTADYPPMKIADLAAADREGQHMIEQAGFTLRGRNPDVLTCIANLSNDEVFTPPEFAARMLDTLAQGWADAHDGANIWADRTVTFLDPCTKSGVFLREITKRLIAGLEPQIPDLQKRVDHILTRQVFGIGITQLTALLARRSLYCSKHATGRHSVASVFDNDNGNIWFERTKHTWAGGKCTFCGAPKALFGRAAELENYAYAFIHTTDIKAHLTTLFGDDMQFDVIIGNPPYQMTGGAGGTSDYQSTICLSSRRSDWSQSSLAWSFHHAGWQGDEEWTVFVQICWAAEVSDDCGLPGFKRRFPRCRCERWNWILSVGQDNPDLQMSRPYAARKL